MRLLPVYLFTDSFKVSWIWRRRWRSEARVEPERRIKQGKKNKEKTPVESRGRNKSLRVHFTEREREHLIWTKPVNSSVSMTWWVQMSVLQRREMKTHRTEKKTSLLQRKGGRYVTIVYHLTQGGSRCVCVCLCAYTQTHTRCCTLQTLQYMECEGGKADWIGAIWH